MLACQDGSFTVVAASDELAEAVQAGCPPAWSRVNSSVPVFTRIVRWSSCIR